VEVQFQTFLTYELGGGQWSLLLKCKYLVLQHLVFPNIFLSWHFETHKDFLLELLSYGLQYQVQFTSIVKLRPNTTQYYSAWYDD